MGSVLSLLVMFRLLLVFQVLLSSLLAVADVLENLPGPKILLYWINSFLKG